MSWRDDQNISIVSGRLTMNPELRRTPSGVAVTDICIASNRYTSTGEQRTLYVKTTVWDKQAEILANPEKGIKSGDYVMIKGRLVNDNHETVKDNVTTKYREIKIENAVVKMPPRKVVRVQE